MSAAFPRCPNSGRSHRLLPCLHSFSFVPFGVLLVLGFVFAWYNVPETRGKTLEQIEREMRART